MYLSKEVFEFIEDLKQHNNREWFAENKPVYEERRNQVASFCEAVLSKLRKNDILETPSGKKSLFRIYRDVRFSKNKEPYKTNFAAHFKRAGADRRGGYYLHIEPDNCFVGGGFWAPSSEDLATIRQSIDLRGEDFDAVFNSKQFKAVFGEIGGDKLKTAPKGYPKDHPYIHLLRHKQFVVSKKFTSEEALQNGFADYVVEVFEAMRPFFDLFSEVLQKQVRDI